MKRLLQVILIISILFVTVGCDRPANGLTESIDPNRKDAIISTDIEKGKQTSTETCTVKETSAKLTVVETECETPPEDRETDLFFNRPSSSCETFRIDIYKELRRLELFADGTMIGRFAIALGYHPTGHKEREGDGKTPEGRYYICFINRYSQYHLFYGLSYPGIEDAEKAFSENRINEAQFENIKHSIQRGGIPDWYTSLGGEVGIHGGGVSRDWTLGCIALTDEDIDLLDTYIGLGTEVNIFP